MFLSESLYFTASPLKQRHFIAPPTSHKPCRHITYITHTHSTCITPSPPTHTHTLQLSPTQEFIRLQLLSPILFFDRLCRHTSAFFVAMLDQPSAALHYLAEHNKKVSGRLKSFCVLAEPVTKKWMGIQHFDRDTRCYGSPGPMFLMFVTLRHFMWQSLYNYWNSQVIHVVVVVIQHISISPS